LGFVIGWSYYDIVARTYFMGGFSLEEIK